MYKSSTEKAEQGFYDFPPTVPLEKIFSDCLELSADERYTVRTARSDTLVSQIIKHEGSANKRKAVTVRVRGIRGKSIAPKIARSDIACTICTQSTMLNLGDNGVVEWQ